MERLSSMDRRQKKDQTDSTLLKYFCHQIQEQVLLGSPFALPALTVHLSHDESVSIWASPFCWPLWSLGIYSNSSTRCTNHPKTMRNYLLPVPRHSRRIWAYLHHIGSTLVDWGLGDRGALLRSIRSVWEKLWSWKSSSPLFRQRRSRCHGPSGRTQQNINTKLHTLWPANVNHRNARHPLKQDTICALSGRTTQLISRFFFPPKLQRYIYSKAP